MRNKSFVLYPLLNIPDRAGHLEVKISYRDAF